MSKYNLTLSFTLWIFVHPAKVRTDNKMSNTIFIKVDLTLSPVHHAARRLSDLIDVNEGRGISLRFPRFLRVRSDKTIFEATSSQEIIQFFSNQSQRR